MAPSRIASPVVPHLRRALRYRAIVATFPMQHPLSSLLPLFVLVTPRALSVPSAWMLARSFLQGLRRLCLLGGGLLLLHCGGRTEITQGTDPDDDPGSDRDQSAENEESDEPTAPNDGSTEADDREEWEWGSQPLEACKKGRAPSSGSCDWLAQDLCYTSKEAACDCICPRDRDSICLSGFFGGPNSKTPVYCE